MKLLRLLTILFLVTYVQFAAAQVPLNDECTGSTFLYLDQTGNTCVSDSTLGATSDGAFNACDATTLAPIPAGGNEVWFSYVVTGSVNTITVTPIGVNPAQKVSVTVINGNCFGGGSTNVCNTAPTAIDQASVAFTSFAGTQIWFYVTALEADGEFLVCVSSTNGFITPALSCNSATSLCNTYDFTSPGSAQPGTSPTPSCFNSPPVRPFWYKFTSGYTGPLEFTGFPTNVGGFRWALYDITSGCPGTEIACNSVYDPFLPFGMSSSVVNCTTPYCPPVNIALGNTYALMIDDTSQTGSGFDFTWGYDVKFLPTSNFDVDSLIGCGTLTADFSDNCIYNPSTNYNFNYGDGTPPVTGSGAAFSLPSHTYGPGTYLVTLTLSELGGCSHSFSRQIIVKPKPLVSFTTSDDTLCFDGSNPTTSDFTANTSNSDYFYDWSFTGSSASLVTGYGTATGFWNQAGTFIANLQVTVEGCASDTVKDTIVVLDIPSGAFTLPDSGCTGTDVAVTYTGGAGASANYAWTYGGGTVTNATNQYFDITWNTPSTYTLTLAVEEAGCLGFTYTDSIRIFDTPTVDFNEPFKICKGEIITLTPLATGAPAGSVYSWDFGNASLLGGSPGDGSTGTLQWSTAGATYVVVQALSPEGCLSAKDSTPLTVNSLPDAAFTLSSNQICGTDSSVFTYTGLAPVATTNFAYDFSGANILNFGSTGPIGPFNLSYNSAGTYPIFLVTNDNVCNSDTIRDTIIVSDNPISFAGNDQQICAGQGIGIGTIPTAGYTYSWTPSQFLSAPFGSNPIATVSVFGSADTLVSFIVTTSLGFCDLNDTMDLNVTAVQQAFFIPPNPQCETGNSFDFTPYYGIVPGATQTWIIGNDTIAASQVNNYNFTTSGSQTVTLETQTPGCPPDQYSSSVLVHPNPVVDFNSNITEGCAPLDVIFTDLSPAIAGASYLWNFGDGIISFLNNPTHTYSNEGSFDVTLTLTSADTCSTTDTLSSTIDVYPVPEALFTANPLIASNVNPTFDFEAVFGNSGCYFDFGDGTGDSSCLASHTYSDTGIYTVTLYTSNPGGCADTFSLTVEVRPNYSLYLPTAFSPNNDQINDRFEVFAEGVQKFNIQVYNRFGQLVYNSDNIQETWNGKWLNDGEECPVAVYVYEAEVTDYNRKKHNLRGRITLIR